MHDSRSASTEHIAKDEQCTGSQRVGTYTWQLAAKSLTLTEAKDTCQWRRQILTAQPLVWSQP